METCSRAIDGDESSHQTGSNVRILNLMEAASLAPPRMLSQTSERGEAAVPSDFRRCEIAFLQLERSVSTAKRCDELARSLKYVNDDITSMAIDSFFRTDLWRILGYRGTPEDARFVLKKHEMEIRARDLRARAMSMFASTPKSFVSPVVTPASAPAPTLPERPTSAAQRFAAIDKDGGILIDDATVPLLDTLVFFQQLVEGCCSTMSLQIANQPNVFQFPTSMNSSEGGSRRQVRQRRQSTHAAVAAPSIVGDPLISIARQRELKLSIRAAHTPQDKAWCFDEECNLQRFVALHVLASVAICQVRADLLTARRRLQTCLQLGARYQANPLRAAGDDDWDRCLQLVPKLQTVISEASALLKAYHEKYQKKFLHAIRRSVRGILQFNREVHRWNHHVDRLLVRHLNAKRRTFQSCFTALFQLEKGKLTLEKEPEIFLKIQVFEGLESVILVARNAQELLYKYRKWLAAMESIGLAEVSDAVQNRWMVEIGKRRPSQRSSAASLKQLASNHEGSKEPSVVSCRRPAGDGKQSNDSRAPSIPKSVASATSKKRGPGSHVSSSATEETKHEPAEPGVTKKKRWRFKLYEEAHDTKRESDYGQSHEIESEAIFLILSKILDFVETKLVNSDSASPTDSREHRTAFLNRRMSSAKRSFAEQRRASTIGSHAPVSDEVHKPSRLTLSTQRPSLAGHNDTFPVSELPFADPPDIHPHLKDVSDTPRSNATKPKSRRPSSGNVLTTPIDFGSQQQQPFPPLASPNGNADLSSPSESQRRLSSTVMKVMARKLSVRAPVTSIGPLENDTATMTESHADSAPAPSIRKLPPPVLYFAHSLLGNVHFILQIIKSEIEGWSSEDLEVPSDSGEDSESSGGLLANADPSMSLQMLRRSSSSMSMASSLGSVPQSHKDDDNIPAFVETAQLRTVLRVKQLEARVEKLESLWNSVNLFQEVQASLTHLPPTSIDGDEPDEGALVSPLIPIVGLHSENSRRYEWDIGSEHNLDLGEGGGELGGEVKSALAAVASLEQDLVVLRPGESLIPKPLHVRRFSPNHHDDYRVAVTTDTLFQVALAVTQPNDPMSTSRKIPERTALSAREKLQRNQPFWWKSNSRSNGEAPSPAAVPAAPQAFGPAAAPVHDPWDPTQYSMPNAARSPQQMELASGPHPPAGAKPWMSRPPTANRVGVVPSRPGTADRHTLMTAFIALGTPSKRPSSGSSVSSVVHPKPFC